MTWAIFLVAGLLLCCIWLVPLFLSAPIVPEGIQWG